MAPNTNTSPNFLLQELEPVDPTAKEKIKEILVDGYFYDVTNWIKRHPGGRIIEFYTENGEDASAAVQQFHHRSNSKVGAIMSSLKKRPAHSHELLGPNLDPQSLSRNRALTEDFNKLFHQLEQQDYFKPSLSHLTYRIIELLTLLTFSIILIQRESILTTFLGIIPLGLFLGRCGWLQHEGGHHSLTGNSKVDRWLQMVIMGLGPGLSSSYWSSQHNRHHAMPQRMHRDVDLNTMPLVAFSSKVIKNPEKHKNNFFLLNQAVLFLAIDTFIAVLNWKFFLHPRHAIRRRKYGELICMGLHYGLMYFVGVGPYFAGFWVGSIYMFGNFALSHTHLPVTESPKHWVEFGLEHTMDIEPSWWCCWFMGYLNCQIEHHLFPTMPQFRNRLIKERVMKLAAKYKIPYQSHSYWTAMRMAFRNLENVAQELRKH